MPMRVAAGLALPTSQLPLQFSCAVTELLCLESGDRGQPLTGGAGNSLDSSCAEQHPQSDKIGVSVCPLLGDTGMACVVLGASFAPFSEGH